MRTVKVELPNSSLPDRSYPIHIEKGSLSQVGELMKAAGLSGSAVVVTNPTVGALYAEAVTKSLTASGFEVFRVDMPDGEEYKSLAEASKIYDALIERRFERLSVVVALGGGVVGDLAGFVAATYLRGVPYVQIPTTLLAQVDSSIGGKTAVNHPKGKNLIGSFYQPRLVLIDPETLSTLSERDLRTGVAEIVKHAAIRDEKYFSFLEDSVEGMLALTGEIEEAIVRSCEIKASVVAADERESGLRAILNFGHTFAHAIEAMAGYGTYTHGEAVSMGMALASDLSVKLALTTEENAKRVRSLLEAFGLPTASPSLDPGEVFSSMRLDKKVSEGRIRFVLLRAIGEVEVSEVDDEALKKFLKESF